MSQTFNKEKPQDVSALLAPLRRLHERVRDAVIAACEQSALEELARVDDEASEGDTIYAVDRVSEELLIELFTSEVAPLAPPRTKAERQTLLRSALFPPSPACVPRPAP